MLIFQTINFVGSNSLNLKYQRFTSSICEDIGIRKFKFVARTQILCIKIYAYITVNFLQKLNCSKYLKKYINNFSQVVNIAYDRYWIVYKK